MWDIIFLSLKVASLAMVIVLPLAVATGYFLSRAGIIAKTLVSALVHLPLVMPPVVTGYALLIVFGKNGWVGRWLADMGLGISFSWIGAAVAAAVMAFPLVVRPIRLAFEQVDGELVEMAALLGAGGWRRFFTILAPLSGPGIVAGLVLGFAKALGEFGATITFVANIPDETQTLSLAIYSLLQTPSGDDGAKTLILASIALSVLAVVLAEVLMAVLEKRRDR